MTTLKKLVIILIILFWIFPIVLIFGGYGLYLAEPRDFIKSDPISLEYSKQLKFVYYFIILLLLLVWFRFGAFCLKIYLRSNKLNQK